MRAAFAPFAVLLAAAWLLPGPAAAIDPCKRWKTEVAETVGYVAKLTFYKIDVTFDGEVIRNERDAKEIRKGDRVRIGEIECEDRSVDVEIKSLDRDVKTKVRLLLAVAERESKGAEAIQDLLEVVIERAGSR